MMMLWGEEMDTESIYNFLIYMQLGVIKAAYPSIKKARTKAIALLNYLYRAEDEKNKNEP
jgi:hypothetical protein